MLRVLILLFSLLSLFAEDPFTSGVPSHRNWTSSHEGFLIGGLINPANGHVSLPETDLIADGVEPLALTRYYIPPEPFDNSRPSSLSIRSGWIFFPHTVAVLERKWITADLLYLWEPDGSMLKFEKKGKKPFVLISEGPFLNSNGRDVSGIFDGRNTLVSRKEDFLIVNSKDGTTRYYKLRQSESGFDYFYLQKERLLNGRLILYAYDQHNAVVKVESRDPSERLMYASLERQGKSWVTNTGQKVTYDISIRPGHTAFSIRYIIKHVSSPLNHKKYNYSEWGELRSQSATHPVFSLDYSDSKKVQAIHLGDDLTHEISYEENIATVKHADNTTTKYTIDEKTQSHTISHENKDLYVDFSSEGRLRTICLEDLYKKNFHYDRDPFGNPIREVFVGNLTGKQDKEAHKIHRKYDRHLLLEERASGLTTTYTYAEGTNLIKFKIMKGKDGLYLEEYYAYDNYHNLIESTVAGRTTRYFYRQSPPHLHKVEWIETKEKKIHLHYDQHGRVSQEDHYDAKGIFAYSIFKTYNGRGQITSFTNALGETTTYTYDRSGRLTSSSKPKETNIYDKRGRVTSTSDAIYRTEYQYDASDNLIRKTDRFGRVEYFYQDKKLIKTVQGDKITTSKYDRWGREISRTDANGHTTLYSYNSRNQPILIKHPDGTKESFLYNLNGKLKEHTDPDGNTISYEYDTFGRITKKIYEGVGEESFHFDALHLLSQTDLEGHITYYTYDKLHRKIREERCGRVTEYTYDSLGRVATVTKGGITTRFKYDLLDRVIEESTPQSLIKYTYDEDGNKTSITTGDSTEKFGYDPLGRMTRQEDPLGNVTTIEYSPLQTKTTDPAGITTIETYDRYENLISKEIPNVMTFRYQYDFEGNLVREEEDVYKNGLYLKTLTTTYTYTSKNQVASINKYGEITRYTYTPSGRVKTKQKPDGTLIEYAYDKLGYLTRVGPESFTYNKLGHLIAGTGFTREVDPFGNILKEFLSNGLTIEKTYDDLDRPLTITLPTGTIYYTYDLRLKTITYKGYTHTLEYNLAGHVLSSGLTTFERDLAGQITRIKSPHIDQECYYDSRGNLTFCTPTTYSYDELSQLAGEFDSHFDPPDAPLTGNLIEHNGFKLTYDFLDRLTAANEITYTYDALDRRLSKNDEFYLYDGLTEIGTYKNGCYYIKINNVLMDLDGTLAVPLFDGTHQIRYLIDPTSNAILNEYEFDPFGNPIHIEESLYNPYRYALKHYDEETELIYFGKRYYDPSSKRWITPDPAGPIDLVNLYTFVRNNPFRYRDYIGLDSVPIYDPYANYQTMFQNTWDNPRFHGMLQYTTGLTQLSVGTPLLVASPIGTVIGGVLVSQGFDNMYTGLNTMLTGEYDEPQTSKFFQSIGMPPVWADATTTAVNFMCGWMNPRYWMKSSHMGITTLETVKTIEKEATKNVPKYKSLTQRNARYNLKVFSGSDPARNIHAHHVFPQQHGDFFSEMGINIHDPRYMTWWEAGPHLRNARAYNEKWGEFIRDHGNRAKSTQTLEYGKQMMNKHGIEVNY